MPGQESPQFPEPIIFTYPESVFARRLTRYLDLRSLPYSPIRVPPNLPRPLLSSSLNIHHRRIPILSLGRDIYIDTRLILQKLETFYPDTAEHPSLRAKDEFGRAFEEILESWTIAGGPFWRTAGCIPPQSELRKKKEWMEDRKEGSGGQFTEKSLAENRAWCISQLRVYFRIMEGLLMDGREWLLPSPDSYGEDADNEGNVKEKGRNARPGMADVHAAWVFDWAVHMAENSGIDEEEIEEAVGDMQKALGIGDYPHLHRWVERFRRATKLAGQDNQRSGGVKTLQEGEEAEGEVVKRLLGGEFVERDEDLVVEEGDPLGLKKGQRISVAPSDFGFTHPDKGTLVGLTRNEVVIEVDVPEKQESGKKLRLHFPRVDFKIVPVDD